MVDHQSRHPSLMPRVAFAALSVGIIACVVGSAAGCHRDHLVADGADVKDWISETGADLAFTSEHAGAAGAALRIRFTPAGDANAVTRAVAPDWTSGGWLTMDVFVAADMPVALGMWCRDAADTKMTRTTVLRPGANTVSFPLAAVVGETAQDRRRMASLCLHQWWSQEATLWIAGIRVTAEPEPAVVDDPVSSLAAAYAPPPALTGLSPCRSPLERDDGTLVTAAADWPQRRQDIVRAWHRLMGAWPGPVVTPQITLGTTETVDGVERQRITIRIDHERTLDGYLLVPAGPARRRPAVLSVFYNPEAPAGVKPSSSPSSFELARRGFVALAIGVQPWTVEKHAFYPEGIQPLSYLAYVAATCRAALAAMPEVDAARIGVTGHSYGGKWAMFAACLDEGFACGAWSDCGVEFDERSSNANYWEPWYLGWQPGVQRARGMVSDSSPRTGAYRELMAEGRDLPELMALMAPRPFLVSGGAVDPPARWLALNHVVAVNALLGYRDRVAMTNRPEHAPTREAIEQMVAFFARELALDD